MTVKWSMLCTAVWCVGSTVEHVVHCSMVCGQCSGACCALQCGVWAVQWCMLCSTVFVCAITADICTAHCCCMVDIITSKNSV